MRTLLAFVLFIISNLVYSQSTYVPLNSNYYQEVDRYEVLNGKISESFHSSVKPYTRQAVAAFVDTLSKDTTMQRSKADQFNYTYLSNDNWEWSNNAKNDRNKPLLKVLYKKKSDFYHVNTKDFDLHVNPVLYLQGGYDKSAGSTYLNSRGIEIRGMIDKKIGFYTFFTDNQAIFPQYVADYRNTYGVTPGEGFNKSTSNPRGVDFISARGYINFNVTKHIAVQFGHDRNFIGNGYRSLILSDFAAPYTFLKLNLKIWKLNYTNIFAQMSASGQIPGDIYIPKKYMAFHHLSLNITKNLNIGIFETEMFGKRGTDSTAQFDINYLNPVIFYRYVESDLGSQDNAILGMDYKWNFLKHFSFYGQFVLDEFLIDHVRKGDGFYANKQAVQVGLKYINAFGVKNLDLQGEMNIIRPYTYSHNDKYTNFANYNQSLAHPMGANLREFIMIARYQPLPRISISMKAFYVMQGVDTTGSNGQYNNWGSNILNDYNNRPQDYNNRIGQGIRTNLYYGTLSVSYMLFHNFFIDGIVTYRKYDSAVPAMNSNTVISSLAIRWNIAQRVHEF